MVNYILYPNETDWTAKWLLPCHQTCQYILAGHNSSHEIDAPNSVRSKLQFPLFASLNFSFIIC